MDEESEDVDTRADGEEEREKKKKKRIEKRQREAEDCCNGQRRASGDGEEISSGLLG